MEAAMTTTVYELGNTSNPTVPGHQLLTISPVTLALAVFDAVSSILIIFLVCRLGRVQSSLITNRSGHQPAARNVVYGNNEYDEINEEMMDPTSGNTNSDEPYYSSLVHLE
ncbi:uncharacterized protein LOC124292166 [Haliotis rubra]|uniref:uncharacterized protein LOC124292166 n=1 Tax=Haliotis rubra TaxID=36100 RepID=UPI001EE5426C|nr:uncharacterized protein LOC124292166 [Haliotis rubra]